MPAKFGQLAVEMTAETRDLDKGLKRAGGNISKFANNATTSLKGIAIAAVGAFTVDRVIRFGQEALNTADKIGKMSAVVRLSTDSFQKLAYAFDLAGVNQDEMTTGLRKFTRQIELAARGNKAAVDLFNSLGVSVKDTNGNLRPTEDVLLDVADAVKILTDKGENLNNTLALLFNASGVKLVNALKGGSSELKNLGKEAERLGLVIDNDLIKNAEKTNDAFNKVNKVLTLQLQKAFLQLAGPLTSIANDIVSVTQGFRDFIEVLGNIDAITDSIEFLKTLKDVWGELIDLVNPAHQIRKYLGQVKDAVSEGAKYFRTKIPDKKPDKPEVDKPTENVPGTPGTPGNVNKSVDDAKRIADAALQAQQKVHDYIIASRRDLENRVIANQKSEITRIQLTAEQEIADVKEKTREILKTSEVTAQQRVEIERNAERQIQEIIRNSADQQAEIKKDLVEKIRAQAAREAEISSRLQKEQTDAIRKRAEDAGNYFASAFERAIRSGDSFSEILKGIAADLLTLAARKLAIGALTDIFGGGGGGGGSAIGSFLSLFFAKGGAFSHGVQAFAGGGVVGGPRLFPMAGGIGLMGEKGPEAIMPLRRNGRGQLGVMTAGSGGGGITVGSINVNVESATGTPEDIGKAVDSGIRRGLEQFIDKRIQDAGRPGGVANPVRRTLYRG